MDAADRWIEKLYDAFERLARNPGIGHAREDFTECSILFWPVGAYLIVYRIQVQFVEVLAVTQGARDIPSFLNRREL